MISIAGTIIVPTVGRALFYLGKYLNELEVQMETKSMY